MLLSLLQRARSAADAVIGGIRRCLARWTKPASGHSLVLGTVMDLARSKPELIAENALLRQQLIVLTRTAKRPHFTPADRALLVLLASRVRAWRQALLIVQPETLLRWHRAGFRLVWRWKSTPRCRQPRVPQETAALIKQMARENRLWGAERTRGELRKLGISVSKRTVQKYMRQARPPRPSGQTWATFLRTHARDIWACDFLQVTDLCFRPLFAFVIIELASRRVVHVGVTRAPNDRWLAQQLREATPNGHRPRYLIRDNDGKFGAAFARVAGASGIEIVRTPPGAPRANAVCERFLGSVRRECLDHILVLGEEQLRRVLNEYGEYFNRARPHQGIGQRVPTAPASAEVLHRAEGLVIVLPVLGGLHHEYRRAA
jgi:putative transposase